MRRTTALSTWLACAAMVGATPTLAQIGPPVGPAGNSLGIGSGVGPSAVPGSTAPIYPNMSRDPPSPAAIPPGGYPPVGRFDSSLPPPPKTVPLSRRLVPRDPYDGTTPRSFPSRPASQKNDSAPLR